MRRRKRTGYNLFPRMTPRRIFSVLVMLVLALLGMLRGTEEKDVLQGTVTWVVDGDTVHVDVAGELRKVRLIGVDTPEMGYRERRSQPFAEDATRFTKRTLLNKTVWLEYDVAPRDKYNRHLAYVWTEPPTAGEGAIRRGMFNARLLLEGSGKVITIQPNSRYADLFVRFQAEARDARRGIWKTK